MNVEPTPEVLLILKKQVERAVRPVRAGSKRKLLMREELLGHLMALFADERQRIGTDAEALPAAIARFGEPPVLTEELNLSVGWEERTNYAFEMAGRQLDTCLAAKWHG